jgi:uncharacterized protein YlaI
VNERFFLLRTGFHHETDRRKPSRLYRAPDCSERVIARNSRQREGHPKKSLSPLSFSRDHVFARCTYIKWSDIKSQKMPSVAHRSRRIIPNPREMADGLLEVRRFDCTKSQNAMAKDVAIQIFDIIALCVHAGNCKLVVFSTGLQEIQPPIFCILISSSSYCIE